MKKIKDINTALEVFKEAAKVHGEATETGNYKLGNKNYDLIVKAVVYLKELNQTAQLYQLLDNINLSVRIWAATYLLSVDEKDALKVLVEASKGKGILSLNAELTIQEWKKGHLTNL